MSETPPPENENTEKSMPVDGAPPFAKITTTSTTIARMPIPSMASRILASSLMSRPANRNEITAATDDDQQPWRLGRVFVVRLAAVR